MKFEFSAFETPFHRSRDDRKKNVTSLFFSFFAKALTCAMNLTVWLLFYWIKFISETSACAYSIFFSYNHRVVSSFFYPIYTFYVFIYPSWHQETKPKKMYVVAHCLHLPVILYRKRRFTIIVLYRTIFLFIFDGIILCCVQFFLNYFS